MNAIVNLYDRLRDDYPNRVFVNEFPQALNLHVDVCNILITEIIDTANQNKDNAQLDSKVVRVHVVGTSFENCKEVSKEIRIALDGYTDTFIYQCDFDSLNKIEDIEDGLNTYVLDFTLFEPGEELAVNTNGQETIILVNPFQAVVFQVDVLGLASGSWSTPNNNTVTATFTNDPLINVYALFTQTTGAQIQATTQFLQVTKLVNVNNVQYEFKVLGTGQVPASFSNTKILIRK